MKPFKKILVPVDFSPHSQEAVRIAADLSRRYEATLALAHVCELAMPSLADGVLFYEPGQVEKLLTLYATELSKAKKEAEAAGAVRVETHHLQGIAFNEIVEFARTGNFDLIVMGTHGRTGLEHALMGSVAEKILRKAPCPVLTVKQTKAAS